MSSNKQVIAMKLSKCTKKNVMTVQNDCTFDINSSQAYYVFMHNVRNAMHANMSYINI